MSTISKLQIFRTFSTNDLNQSESLTFFITSQLSSKITSTFSSNAEKLRKNAILNSQIELISRGLNC